MPEPDIDQLRLAYCEKFYLLEAERRNNIERHAQIFFGIITIFVGIVGTNFSGLRRSILLSDLSGCLLSCAWIAMWLFLCALPLSFIAFIGVFLPRSRQKPYPRNLLSRLFIDVGEPEPGELTRQMAERYALATERNSKSNTRISTWLAMLAVTSSLSVLSYATLIALTN